MGHWAVSRAKMESCRELTGRITVAGSLSRPSGCHSSSLLFYCAQQIALSASSNFGKLYCDLLGMNSSFRLFQQFQNQLVKSHF